MPRQQPELCQGRLVERVRKDLAVSAQPRKRFLCNRGLAVRVGLDVKGQAVANLRDRDGCDISVQPQRRQRLPEEHRQVRLEIRLEDAQLKVLDGPDGSTRRGAAATGRDAHLVSVMVQRGEK